MLRRLSVQPLEGLSPYLRSHAVSGVEVRRAVEAIVALAVGE